MPGPDAAFWQKRFEAGDMPWDRGAPGPQLSAWLDSGALQPCRIAVPGCGSGWEVLELARRGFDVVGIDLVPAACERARSALTQARLQAEVVQADVRSYRPTRPFDAVYEQTCLCALHPHAWMAYQESLHAWIRPHGRLFAMFMQCRVSPEGSTAPDGPPYHCAIDAMRSLFDPTRWGWPTDPVARVDHPRGWHELGVCLSRA